MKSFKEEIKGKSFLSEFLRDGSFPEGAYCHPPRKWRKSSSAFSVYFSLALNENWRRAPFYFPFMHSHSSRNSLYDSNKRMRRKMRQSNQPFISSLLSLLHPMSMELFPKHSRARASSHGLSLSKWRWYMESNFIHMDRIWRQILTHRYGKTDTKPPNISSPFIYYHSEKKMRVEGRIKSDSDLVSIINSTSGDVVGRKIRVSLLYLNEWGI